MRLVGLSYLKPGTVLARDIYGGSNGTIPLLRRGVVLNHSFIERLDEAGIFSVYIDDALGDGIEITPLISEQTRHMAADSLGAVFKEIRAGETAAQPMAEETLGRMTAIVELLAAEIANSKDAAVAINNLAAASSYTVQHSINVTALGLLIGERCLHDYGWVDYQEKRRMDRTQDQLVQLGLGLMLHDIGKSLLPKELLSKAGPLGPAEWEIVRLHPLNGVAMLSPITTSARARAVVRSHHERWDGAGYPDGKIAKATHQFARIAALADAYDAITSERPYSRAQNPEYGWNIILEGSGSAFDPEIVNVFRQVVAPYPPGSEITLDDGRRGLVVSVQRGALEQPLVRICWDAEGKPVDVPYELELDELPGRASVPEPISA
ncbi:MAG TPA: HD-GYP domain-containing protein [Gaiellaceae bacterium]|nr:HD-GYP domain-containing protein [Gaiellaceae bacterium]